MIPTPKDPAPSQDVAIEYCLFPKRPAIAYRAWAPVQTTPLKNRFRLDPILDGDPEGSVTVQHRLLIYRYDSENMRSGVQISVNNAFGYLTMV